MAALVLSIAGAAAGSSVLGPIGAIVGRLVGAVAGNVIDQALFGARRRFGTVRNQRFVKTELIYLRRESAGKKATLNAANHHARSVFKSHVRFILEYIAGKHMRLGKLRA